jgi:hypothetical protein
MTALLIGILVFSVLAGAQWLVLYRIFERIDPQPERDEHETAYDTPFHHFTYLEH